MKIRVRSLVLLGAACMCGGLLMHISQRVQESQESLKRLHAQMDAERESIIMLQAEWEALNAPSRLEVLAKKYLDLKPAETRMLRAQIPDSAPPVEIMQVQPVAIGVEPKAVQP
ncbi:MAG: hypothetical protein L6Q57_03680 [Alphaproteobacteria bacterium]|nr:hypothetical protein [Alphaproteobacteria bacterium]